MFNTLSDRLTTSLRNLRGRGRLAEADVDAVVRDIRIALLDADVAVPVVRQFCSDVRARSIGAEVSRALNPAQQVIKIVNEELVAVLGGDTRRLEFARKSPTVVMLVGLQGSGKTTFAGKLARSLAREGRRPVLVAADLQRPNAVDQLRVVAQRAGVEIYAPEPGNGVGDPVSVARNAKGMAADRGFGVVIIDTAGRLAMDAEMMAQARAIREAVDPENVLFVVDAMIGQDAVRTATSFQEQVGFDGVALTKLDGDARGGAALSIRHVTGRPVMFASVGEGLDDLEVFHPDRMASRILDMGDLLTLIEQAELAFDAEQAERMAGKAARGEDFTLDDFLEQMQAVKKMGSLGKVLGMLPGMGDVKQQLAQVDDRDIDRISAIIQSMTPAERAEPKVIDGSRRARIARGSGVTVAAVNNLLTRFGDAQKMMRQMRGSGLRGGVPQVPGMPPIMGGSSGRRKKGRAERARGRKGRSGNPAKRAAQQARQAARGDDPGAGVAHAIPSELPAEIRDLLGPTS